MTKRTVLGLILAAAMPSAGCGGDAASDNQNVAATGNAAANDVAATAESNKPAPPKNAQTAFEKALFNVRTGDFDQVLSFARKDGAALTKDDIEFFKTASENEQGREINRRLKSDDNRFILTGTNFRFLPEQLERLQQRFAIRDYTESNDGADFDLNRYRADEKARLEKAAADKAQQDAQNQKK